LNLRLSHLEVNLVMSLISPHYASQVLAVRTNNRKLPKYLSTKLTEDEKSSIAEEFAHVTELVNQEKP
jgi:hypothetical protein